MVEDLVDVVEWVLLVDDGVEEDAQGPDVLLFAAVGLALQDLGGGVVYERGWSVVASMVHPARLILPIVPTKTSNGPFLI